jgi:translation initiation factor IF-1
MQHDATPENTSQTNPKATKDGVFTGKVVETLPNTLFRIELENGVIQLSYLAGKMRINKIKVLLGDTVQVQVDPYGGRGRIIKRL